MPKLNRSGLEKALDKAWSLFVRDRDQECQKCHGKGSVAPHHAFGRRHRATRWDVMNGVGLCFACHIHWAHRDPAGFAEWFRNHVGDDQYNRLAEIHNQAVKHSMEELRSMLEWFKQQPEGRKEEA